jgi:2-polyprenyl-6-methoxyphenol hydroxylase-like FAD-dependent oxidoreductase
MYPISAGEYHMFERDIMFSKERVGFVGDAAHAVEPLLAQGI